MPVSSTQLPCSNCRDRHQKCDRGLPVCRRCELKGLNCKPVQRKKVFRLGSTANLDANFRDDQTWVNSRPRNWKPPAHSNSIPESRSTAPEAEERSGRSPCTPQHMPNGHDTHLTPQSGILDSDEPRNGDHQPEPSSDHALWVATYSTSPLSDASRRSVSPMFSRLSERQESCSTNKSSRSLVAGEQREQYLAPVAVDQASAMSSYDLQESCLLRYFIEELSPWFDHCDERRHFQLVVPGRAEHCLALRNAIFAVSSRHLCRLPQYMTTQGIFYHNQPLPELTKSTSLEYMLKCIPELIRFHEIQDLTHQENIMAATVILRQYEEMEEELEEGEIGNQANERVNFLAITHTIIDTMISAPLDYSLASAAFWITARQDVYHALTRQRAPEFHFGTESWNASTANTMVIFANKVAKWRWGTKLPQEWDALKEQHHELSRKYTQELKPTLDQKADRANGLIFPTIWYLFEAQVTAAQHLKLGEMILIAESPYLEKARSAVHRKAEAQVCEIVLSLCGIALGHPRCQPALVTAVIAITLYGEYFTRLDEREALRGIIKRTMDLHAWPMRKAYEALHHAWDTVDNLQL